jgi:hypothetical protein
VLTGAIAFSSFGSIYPILNVKFVIRKQKDDLPNKSQIRTLSAEEGGENGVLWKAI